MKEPRGHKILLADDERIARTLVRGWLESWGYEVVIAERGDEALAILEAQQDIHLCLLDWVMPGLDGVDVCRKLRAGPPEPYRYLILLTARSQPEHVVEGLEAGADDYIVKPCNMLELRVRLRAGARVVELQKALLDARDAMRFEATHDALTGVLNRAGLLKELDSELNRSSRVGRPLSVLYVDVDHFKRVNDDRGHATGDLVLLEITRRLGQGVRAYDKLGRLGGEEFLVILPECDTKLGVIVAERLRRLVARAAIDAASGGISCSVSVGVAGTDLLLGVSREALVQAADRALYRAKAEGRDRVVVASLADLQGGSAMGDEAIPTLRGE
jgi:two-component system cell cycle response regulator